VKQIARTCLRSSVAPLVTVTLLATVAEAEIFSYEVSKIISYTQSSAATPTNGQSWLFNTSLYYGVPDEVLSASVSFDVPPPVILELYPATPTFHIYYSGFYASQAELDAEYPSTTYALTIDRGTGPETADVFLPVDLYCPEIPYFTGDTYDRLQSYDPALPLDVYINGFTLPPGANVGVTLLSVSEEQTGSVLSTNLNPDETHFQIPAGTLQPSRNYVIGISYLSSLQIPGAGLGGATSAASFSRGTAIYFTTLPVLGDCNADGAVNLTDYSGFPACLTGPGGGVGGSSCACFDIDEDADTDLADFAALQTLVAGA